MGSREVVWKGRGREVSRWGSREVGNQASNEEGTQRRKTGSSEVGK